jgi:hypothetical protein
MASSAFFEMSFADRAARYDFGLGRATTTV